MLVRTSRVCRCQGKLVGRKANKLPRYNQQWNTSIQHVRSFFASGKNSATLRENVSSYWASLKWFSIPASLGFAYICYQKFRHIQKREREIVYKGSPEDALLADWQVEMFKQLPTRFLSKLWGKLCNIEIPESLRSPILNLYISMYNCNMDEAVEEDLRKYNTFHNFFIRKLKPEVRTVHETSSMVSPVDGTVLHFGEMNLKSMHIEQVKGISYSLGLFVGPRHPFVKNITSDVRMKSLETETSEISQQANSGGPTVQGEKTVYYCNIYLAPGDYHWFHSPTDWQVFERRHIPGLLLSVSPSMMKSIQGLFNFNERILVSGKWKHGSMLFGAIGAFNVGSINLIFDMEKGLETNSPFAKAGFSDRLYGGRGLKLQRGDPIGYFSLGSSVVLVFTAPKSFKFHLQPGQKIKLGEALGTVPEGPEILGG